MERKGMENSVDTERAIKIVELGSLGVGPYGPDTEKPDMQRAFVERLKGDETYVDAVTSVICGCMDDRCGCPAVPNAAGGSETLLIADDLTDKNFELDGDDSLEGQFARLIEYLNGTEHPVGGHIDCAALAKVAVAYPHMLQNGDDLRRKVTEIFGYTISDDDHNGIMAAIAARTEYPDGEKMLSTLQENGGRVDAMDGEHSPRAIVIDLQAGKTLNRYMLRDEFGDDFKALNIDGWAFTSSSETLPQTSGEDGARRKAIAMAYFNLGVASLLCNSSTPVVVRS